MKKIVFFCLSYLSIYSITLFTYLSASEPTRVEIRNTEKHFLSSSLYKEPFEIDIFLPKSYKQNRKKKYPILIITDAEYNFGLVSYVTRRLIKNKEIPEIILVGIAYDSTYDEFYANRQRDLTPTLVKKRFPSGGAEKFISFIESDLLSFLKENYRVNIKDKTLVGHSYGGLFGYYTLFNHTHLFQRYLLVSPSLWYDNRVSFNFEKKYASTHSNLKATLFTSIGDQEKYMVDDLKRMVKILKSRNYKDLKIDFRIHDDETHRSVFATAFTKGLKSIFKHE